MCIHSTPIDLHKTTSFTAKLLSSRWSVFRMPVSSLRNGDALSFGAFFIACTRCCETRPRQCRLIARPGIVVLWPPFVDARVNMRGVKGKRNSNTCSGAMVPKLMDSVPKSVGASSQTERARLFFLKKLRARDNPGKLLSRNPTWSTTAATKRLSLSLR